MRQEHRYTGRGELTIWGKSCLAQRVSVCAARSGTVGNTRGYSKATYIRMRTWNINKPGGRTRVSKFVVV